MSASTDARHPDSEIGDSFPRSSILTVVAAALAIAGPIIGPAAGCVSPRGPERRQSSSIQGSGDDVATGNENYAQTMAGSTDRADALTLLEQTLSSATEQLRSDFGPDASARAIQAVLCGNLTATIQPLSGAEEWPFTPSSFDIAALDTLARDHELLTSEECRNADIETNVVDGIALSVMATLPYHAYLAASFLVTAIAVWMQSNPDILTITSPDATVEAIAGTAGSVALYAGRPRMRCHCLSRIGQCNPLTKDATSCYLLEEVLKKTKGYCQYRCSSLGPV